MKILVICQHYFPEPFRIADICEELVRRGNEVTVVTGVPNYPMGEIYPGYENGQKMDEVIDGVNVHRCNIHPRKKGALHRVWNYYSFPYKSKKYIKTLDEAFDVVFVYQLSPVMMANAGIKYAKKFGRKTILYCLDLWPASLGVGGINRGIIYKWFYRESKKVYAAVDKILISSKSFAAYFDREFGIKKTAYLPQYAEDTFTPEDCRKKPDDKLDLMFAGNVGTAQSVDTIIKAAAKCKDIPNLRWHIVGDGVELNNCKRLADEMDVPVIFHGRKSIEQMPKYYAMADAMLVTMKKDPIINLTLPGKVQSYMASGKPVIGAIDGETNLLVNSAGCGEVTTAENEEGLARIVRELNHEKLSTYSEKALAYSAKYFQKEKFLKCLMEALTT